jgi:hypothetical protein
MIHPTTKTQAEATQPSRCFPHPLCQQQPRAEWSGDRRKEEAQVNIEIAEDGSGPRIVLISTFLRRTMALAQA